MNHRTIFRTLTIAGLLALRAHADVFTAVPEAAAEGYQLLYELPVTTNDAIWNGPTPVPYSSKKLVILVRPLKFRVAFTQLPKNRQLYPRATTTNQAAVPIAGKESFGGFDTAVLKVSRNGVPQSAHSVKRVSCPAVFKRAASSSIGCRFSNCPSLASNWAN